ncbi:MAG: WD40 repeat domain-containing protein [Planctomycetaceae bacterium]
MSLREIHPPCRMLAVLALCVWPCVQTNVAAQALQRAARVASIAPLSAELPAPTVTALAIDPSGQWLAVAGDDKTIRILQAATFTQMAILQGHRDLIRTLDFRHDGRILASSGNDGSLILWEQASGYRELRRVDDLPAIACARFSREGKQIAAVGFGPEVMMFGSKATGMQMRCDCTDLRACAFDQRGERLAVTGRSGHLHLFDPRTGQALGEHDLHAGRIRACAFDRDGGHMITVGEDGAAVLFDLNRGEVLRRVDLLPCKLFALAAIDDTRIAVAGSDNRIRIVDLASGLVLMHLDGHRGSISTLVYKDGSLYSGGFDSTLRHWSIQADGGERLAEKEQPTLPPQETSSR